LTFADNNFNSNDCYKLYPIMIFYFLKKLSIILKLIDRFTFGSHEFTSLTRRKNGREGRNVKE